MKRGLTDSMIYDEKAVRERYGLEPEQMIDFKALRGDPSDNIPGVKGIGEKTAAELLQEFGTLEEVYEYVEKLKTQNSKLKSKEEIKERILNLLVQYKDDALISKELATIKCDAKIDFKLDKARFGDFDQEKLAKLFNELEFRSLLPRLQGLSRDAKKRLEKSEDYEQIDKFKRNL